VPDDRLWGQNVAAAEGEHWKRHRRIANPAFNPATSDYSNFHINFLYLDMMKTEGWYGQDEVYIPVLQSHLFKVRQTPNPRKLLLLLTPTVRILHYSSLRFRTHLHLARPTSFFTRFLRPRIPSSRPRKQFPANNRSEMGF